MSFALQKVSFTYPKEQKPILTDFSLTLNRGERLALLGPSGSGKTTLMRLLLGFLEPSSGSLERDEGARIGVVFQEDRLFPQLTLRENWALVLEKGENKAEMESMAHSLGLEDALDKPISELSGGMKRRGAIGRALLYRPDYLFLDEPFKGLDPETRKKVMDLVGRFLAERGLFLITHDIEEARELGAAIISL